ncbi:MAG: hypothetical protein RMK18_03315 [Armatimonadota bacterium]|nr:hypothetical protein [Armatimonadota bacterium]MCX7777052.1 hypothetical protein [Armatimonadota bacterium]MDW8024879.1 hypothetical protein [Armatimonadota bacterium]
MAWRCFIILNILAIFSASAVNPEKFGKIPKKLVYYGWGIRDTMFVRQNWREMEQMPFEGVGISVPIDRKAWQEGERHTGNQLEWNLFGPKAFRFDDFLPAIEDLKATKWQKFAENFLPACICSTGQDFGFNWFDEKRWKTVVNNWRILVTIAKEGGLKGIILDPEQYGAYFFHYPTMRERVDKLFSEYVERVRQCGRELMEVTRQIFPDITILMFWAHSYLPMHPTERKKPPEQNAYGLLPAFVDGMMEAADERAKFVDLCEFAYGFKERHQFLEAYHSIVNKAASFSLFPGIYRRKILVGFGLWLDYGGQKRWSVDDFGKNYFSPDEFRRSLQMALELTDEYVWIYSQMPRFFPPSNLPDSYLQAIKEARKIVGLQE